MDLRISQICFGSPWPPRYGGAIRMSQLAKRLAELSELQLIVFPIERDRVDEVATREHLALGPAEVVVVDRRHESRAGKVIRYLRALRRGEAPASLQLGAGSRRQIEAAVSAWRPRIVLLEYSYLAALIPSLRERHPAARYVVDCHNVESSALQQFARAPLTRAQRIRYRIAATATAAAERRYLPLADALWACSEADRRQLRELTGPKVPIELVPNPLWPRAAATVSQPVPASAGLVGDFSYPPNRIAAEWLIDQLPRVAAAVSEPRLFLIGRHPSRKMRKAASGGGWVVVTGEVEDPAEWLARVQLVTIPLVQGGGTRLKILEAMCLGKAVLATPKAVEGLAFQDGVHLRISELEHFVDAWVELLDDVAARRKLEENAGAVSFAGLEAFQSSVRTAVDHAVGSGEG